MSTPSALASPTSSGFLHLPPEIRNHIYELAIPHARVVIVGNQPQKELACQRQRPSPVSTPSELPTKAVYRLRGRLTSYVNSDSKGVATSLLRACRTVNHEVTTVLYPKTIVCFRSIRTINKFLNVASKRGLESIKRLELRLTMYGEPHLTEARKWKTIHDQKWTDTCTRLAREMTSLQSLQMTLRICDWPVQFSPDASWAEPLLTLAGAGLNRVRLVLKHGSFDPKSLAAIALNMENLMMTQEGREKRDLAEALRAVRESENPNMVRPAVAPPMKTLVLKIPPSSKGSISVYKPIYKTRGLESFARIDPATLLYPFAEWK